MDNIDFLSSNPIDTFDTTEEAFGKALDKNPNFQRPDALPISALNTELVFEISRSITYIKPELGFIDIDNLRLSHLQRSGESKRIYLLEDLNSGQKMVVSVRSLALERLPFVPSSNLILPVKPGIGTTLFEYSDARIYLGIPRGEEGTKFLTLSEYLGEPVTFLGPLSLVAKRRVQHTITRLGGYFVGDGAKEINHKRHYLNAKPGEQVGIIDIPFYINQ